MTTHPSSLDLEAFACGETMAAIESHLGDCTACSAFVERLRGALSAGPSPSRAAEVVARAAVCASDPSANETVAPTATSLDAARRRRLLAASSVAAPLAAAAVFLLLTRSPSTKDALIPAPTLPSTAQASTGPTATAEDPETTFKGGIQIAVIRERAGRQTRFTGTVAIVAAVMGEDASWLELMPEGTRRPGTHFSERSARVDASPLRGPILVGPPAMIARARATKRFEGLPSIRVEWEAP
ncbi:MAG: hypothetical protein K0S65_6808 [Labilithrix sp.]|nr:hypothetical protein [Labilithrix sp.]